MKILNSTEFDLLNAPLRGRNLIEASAGTGKTYTLSRLFLRLLVEMQFDISNILVVTFTEAATQELRERIYNVLSEAENASKGRTCNDAFITNFISKFDRKITEQLLTNALRSFDSISVHTIHGFCQKVLSDNAFESKSSFDAKLVTDQTHLIDEIVSDFWRTNISNASHLFASYALDSLSPKILIDLYTKTNRLIKPVFIHDAEPIIEPNDLENQFIDKLDQFRQIWHSSKDSIFSIISNAPLNKTKYSEKLVSELCRTIDAFVESKQCNVYLVKYFNKLSTSFLQSATKTGCTIQSHLLFDICESICQLSKTIIELYEIKLLRLKQAFLNFMHEELCKRKEKQNILYFDDLLINVSKNLSEETQDSAIKFKKAIQNRYKAALIDEFQDTDALQWGIFNKIFENNVPLFLIGDPKQAIYSFRGADIFAYVDAALSVDTRYTLSTNYRSDPKLVNAINIMFGSHCNPFFYDAITYHQIAPGIEKEKCEFTINGSPHPAMNVLYLDTSKDLYKLNRNELKKKISDWVSGHIAQLIDQESNSRIASNRIKPEDIAVLVRTNIEAQLIRASLNQKQINAVIDSSGSVFETNEARDLERLLLSIAEPSRVEYLRAALVSNLFGYSISKISELDKNITEWDAIASRFYGYREEWSNKGVMHMMKSLMTNEHLKQNLLSNLHGERTVTNLLHLIELLHLQEVKSSLSIEKLLNYLIEKRLQPSNHTADEEMIRLESDDSAVRIVTIHKSKGLEYPIVFCPFCWNNAETPKIRKNEPFVFHESGNDRKLMLALSQKEIDENLEYAEQEQLAESIRLLYVALTRAKSCCYLVWGTIKNTASSAPAYLLHCKESAPQSISALISKFNGLSPLKIAEDIKSLGETDLSAIGIKPLELSTNTTVHIDKQTNPNLRFKQFHEIISPTWKVASFTSLTHSENAATEMPDYDIVIKERVYENNIADQEQGMLGFPRGAHAGTLLHEILEHADLSKPESDANNALVDTKLRDFGIEVKWASNVLAMIQDLSNRILLSTEQLALGKINTCNKLHELEFYYLLKNIAAQDIKNIFAKQNVQTDLFTSKTQYEADGLIFSPVSGFLKGYIDLVFEYNGKFYIVDWKSNYLGSNYLDYMPDQLTKAMIDNHYMLQYSLYSVALHLYLKQRKRGYSYNKHFGGVYYLFLRGFGLDQSKDTCGIYFDKPHYSLISDLTSLFIEEKQAEAVSVGG